MKRMMDLFILFSLAITLLASCAPVSVEMPLTASGEPTDGGRNTITSLARSSSSSVPDTEPSHSGKNTNTPLFPSVALDYQAVASGIQAETVDAVPPDANSAWFDQFPQHIQFTLQNYLLQNSQLKPQIFIYPLKDLAAYPGPEKSVTGLLSLLKDKQIEQQLPCLPYFYDRQVLHPQLQFMDFKSGHGVRYLTQFSQAAFPIVNNLNLVYIYQGITTDDRYYVSAVLPINQPDLPISETVSPDLVQDATTHYDGYLADVTNQLGNASPASFTPNINELDKMIQSLEIK